MNLPRLRSEEPPDTSGVYWYEAESVHPIVLQVYVEDGTVMVDGAMDIQELDGKWTGPLPGPGEIVDLLSEDLGLRVGVDEYGFIVLETERGQQIRRQAGVTYEVIDDFVADVQTVNVRVMTDPRMCTDKALERTEEWAGEWTVEEHIEAQRRAKVPRSLTNYVKGWIRGLCHRVLRWTQYSMFK